MLIVNRQMLDVGVFSFGDVSGETTAFDSSGDGVLNDRQITLTGGEVFTFGDGDKNLFTGQVTDMGGDRDGPRAGLFKVEVNQNYEPVNQNDPNLTFNADIGYWDVSNVETMEAMFNRADAFNQDIGAWDVSNVESTWQMFDSASSFNQDIGAWDVSKVEYMARMFNRAHAFNQDIGAWDVSKVTYMGGMFWDASSFNQDLRNWNVQEGLNNFGFAEDATSFAEVHHPIWDVETRRLQIDFQRRRDGIVARAESFVETGRGNIDDLAAALEIDYLATLERLERGATLSLRPVEGLTTVTYDGERHYRLAYTASSPFQKLENEVRASHSKHERDYWGEWLALTTSSSGDRTELYCLFRKISQIPRKVRDVRMELLSFSQSGGLTKISFLCR